MSDGAVTVRDDGRGMPTDEHPKEKVPAVEVIFTRLHAGGKFKTGIYESSGGLHGVGAAVVNALSRATRSAGAPRQARARNGVRRRGARWKGPTSQRTERPKTGRKGTSVRFWPDERYFEHREVPLKALRETLKAKAVLCPGLEVVLEVEGQAHTEVVPQRRACGALARAGQRGSPGRRVARRGGKQRAPCPVVHRLERRGRREPSRELRKPHSNTAGRKPREGIARRPDRSGAPIRRTRWRGAEGNADHARGRIRPRTLCAQHPDPGAESSTARRRND